MTLSQSLNQLLVEIRDCSVCDLPLGPRPIVSMAERARVVIIGQAPGTKVHASGVPWDDTSGEHLREWLGIDAERFYDPQRVAIVPMGLCYPGKRRGGDAPPRPECAPLWHERLFAHLPEDRLTLLVGQYAQRAYLGARRKKTLTETVRAWREYSPEFIVTPHPSWRSRGWMAKNPFFEEEVLPSLKQRVLDLTR
jgi:uracil-DNA glycosylase